MFRNQLLYTNSVPKRAFTVNSFPPKLLVILRNRSFLGYTQALLSLSVKGNSMKPIHIRKASIEDAFPLAKTHVDAWRSAYKEVIPQSYLDSLSYDERHAMWTDILTTKSPTSIQLVAVNEDNTIIGFIAGGEARDPEFSYDAELYALYLLPEYQGQGIGKKLMLHLTEWLIRNGYHGLYLWVLEKNRTRYFYEKLGGKQLKYSRTEIFDNQPFVEIVYGWDDLNALLKKSQ